MNDTAHCDRGMSGFTAPEPVNTKPADLATKRRTSRNPSLAGIDAGDVERGGRDLDIASSRAAGALAILIVEPGDAVLPDQIFRASVVVLREVAALRAAVSWPCARPSSAR